MECATAPGRWGTPTTRLPDEARAFDLGDGVWRLRLPLPYQQVRAVNAYAIATDDGCCLVDCGSSLEPGWEALVTALGGAGYAPSDVHVLVATHTHSDHFGLAATLVARTGCELRCAPGPRPAADALRDPALPEAERRRHARRAGVPDGEIAEAVRALDGGDGYHERNTPARALHGGDVVEARNGPWRVLEAPGHAPNQLVLHCERSGWLISADLALEGSSPYLEYGYGGDPVEQHLAAVRDVLAVEPTRMLPGHGPPVDDPGPVLSASAAAVRERLTGLVARLDSAPRTPFELALERAGGADAHPDRRQMALSTTLCDLDHLERRGLVRSLDGGDGVRRVVRGEQADSCRR